jgi:hypothetical protein
VDEIGEHSAGALAAVGVDRIAGESARLVGRKEGARCAQLASGQHHVRARPPERRGDLAHELVRVPARLGARAVGQQAMYTGPGCSCSIARSTRLRSALDNPSLAFGAL